MAEFAFFFHLPIEITTSIFAELKKEDLWLCELVCKAWNMHINAEPKYYAHKSDLVKKRVCKYYPQEVVHAFGGAEALCLLPQYNAVNRDHHSIFRDFCAADPANQSSYDEHSVLFKTYIQADPKELQQRIGSPLKPKFLEFVFYYRRSENQGIALKVHTKNRVNRFYGPSTTTTAILIKTLMEKNFLELNSYYAMRDRLYFTLCPPEAPYARDEEKCTLF
jgi:hypothetical protein